MANGNGGYEVSITSLSLFATIIFSVVGAQWIETQNNFTHIAKEQDIAVGNLKDLINQARQEAQSRDNGLKDELYRREAELKLAVTAINSELLARRSEFVGQAEFRQFEQRFERESALFQKRLDVVESTRPTTGELQATANAFKEQLNALKKAP